MSDQKPFISFEGNAIRRALGELAATGPGYVRLGALKVMASMLGIVNDPLADADPHRDQRLDAVLDEVEAILGEALLSDANVQTADPDAESDPETGDDRDNQAEQQEDEDDDDEPP
ncbi:MAG: hypothetical protein OXD50_04190 [Chloroflexi bacterium]|nr:hypothetical protein [Chloroflexota bacterium]